MRNERSNQASIILAVAGSVMGSGGTTVAHAQERQPPIEEITVTAQKFEQSLQDVPASVSAIGAAELQEIGAVGFLDYVLRTPSVSFGFTGTEGRANRDFTLIRGLNSAFYLNEASIPLGINPRISDVERVEVLRGPQGTLYGAGAQGGVLKVVTRRPDSENRSLNLQLSTAHTSGSDDPNYSGDFALNLPISEGVAAARISGYYDRQAGFIDRIYGQSLPYATDIPTDTLAKGVSRDVNGSEVYGGRASLLITPSAGWEIAPSILWQRTREHGPTDSDIDERQRGTQRRAFDIDESLYATDFLGELTLRYSSDKFSVVSVSSWLDREYGESEDDTEAVDGTFRSDYADPLAPPVPSIITNERNAKAFQQELRISGGAQKLQWIAGLYYTDREQRRDAEWVMPGWSSDPRYVDPGFGDLLFWAADVSKSKEKAVFGSLTYQLTERLELTAGLRRFETQTSFVFPSAGYFGDGAGGESSGRQRETGTTPRVNLSFKATQDVLLYATVAEGFRLGGAGSALPDSCNAEASGLGIDPAAGYKSDTTRNYEVGMRSKWGAGTVVNAAIYQIDWTDLQQTVYFADCGYAVRGNVGEARIRGAELETRAFPLDSLEVGATLGYIDGEITDPGTGTFSEAGDRPLNTPKLTASAMMQFGFQFSERLPAYLRVDYQYLGESFTTFNQDDPLRLREVQAYRRRPAYDQVDARLAVKMNEKMEIALFGKNLTDEEANFGQVTPIGIARSGRNRFVTNWPRTIGVSFTADF